MKKKRIVMWSWITKEALCWFIAGLFFHPHWRAETFFVISGVVYIQAGLHRIAEAIEGMKEP